MPVGRFRPMFAYAIAASTTTTPTPMNHFFFRVIQILILSYP